MVTRKRLNSSHSLVMAFPESLQIETTMERNLPKSLLLPGPLALTSHVKKIVAESTPSRRTENTTGVYAGLLTGKQ